MSKGSTLIKALCCTAFVFLFLQINKTHRLNQVFLRSYASLNLTNFLEIQRKQRLDSETFNGTDVCGTFPETVPSRNPMRILYAINLKDSSKVFPRQSFELLKLLTANVASKSFVSIYESGSKDDTCKKVKEFAKTLKTLGIDHFVHCGKLTKGKTQNRIDFMANLRNAALRPLFEKTFTADIVVFINDVFFCATDLVHSIEYFEKGANMVCGLDFDKRISFYDTWVARDISGKVLGNRQNCDMFPSKEDRTLCLQGSCVPVYSCWNGIVAFHAWPLIERRLRFRLADAALQECPCSECTLFCKDLWNIGAKNICVDSRLRVAYESKVFLKAREFMNSSSPRVETPGLFFNITKPEKFLCEPLNLSSSNTHPFRKQAYWTSTD
ncbi:Alpha-1,3-mannosyltransferase CMT1 [Galdieria sulphuraria]|uniref:Peptidase M48 n=1 Tax=Galdieria sulphuraria TaxID=130081 RepID=M2XUC7_GALSU|nr:peptidase M48 [Galdieria sulphuraria]EME27258.1 peptidase M48 [Galdieria sulphuraria]GJD11318.1 Alpha-1,3-mannosyltransferase CMT1 [Galdieria sulphuraria]|eukprot:XP_005703778.1 peptidase M48 [Galdieria sulphuraria]